MWSLALLSLLPCAALAAPSEFLSPLEARWSQDAYVHAEGIKLVDKGKDYFVSGMNYYGCMSVLILTRTCSQPDEP